MGKDLHMHDQMFCTSDTWVDRPGIVLTVVIKNRCC